MATKAKAKSGLDMKRIDSIIGTKKASMWWYGPQVRTLIRKIVGVPGMTPDKAEKLVRASFKSSAYRDSAIAVFRALALPAASEPASPKNALSTRALRAAALKLVTAQTARVRTPSNRDAAVRDAFEYKSFGCQKERVKLALEAILGHKLNATPNTPTCVPNLALVADSDNDIGLIVGYSVESYDALDEIGETKGVSEPFRPATDKEVRAFIAKLSKAALRRIFGFLEVV